MAGVRCSVQPRPPPRQSSSPVSASILSNFVAEPARCRHPDGRSALLCPATAAATTTFLAL
eukprot:5912176-Pleurochrysis_carterae.AAC.1